MSFKKFYINEGRNAWNMFELKQTNKRWSFKNINSGKRYFIKLPEVNNVGQIQKFLVDVKATSSEGLKTKGSIDFGEFARNIVSKKSQNFYVKSEHWEDIKKSWVI